MAEKTPELELILINISGQDRPGVTSSLTEILAKYDAQILDIGQADIHHNLALGILFKTDSERSGEILKELLFKAYELNVQIRFSPISVEDYSKWVSMQGKNRYIITILGRKLTAKQMAKVTNVVAEQGMNIDGIQRLTGRMPLTDKEQPLSKSCVEFSVRGNPLNKEQMQSDFMQMAAEMEFDISMQEDNMYRRSRRPVSYTHLTLPTICSV